MERDSGQGRRRFLQTTGALLAGGTLGAASASAATDGVSLTTSASRPAIGESVTFTVDTSGVDAGVEEYDWFVDPETAALEYNTFENAVYRDDEWVDTRTGKSTTITLTYDDYMQPVPLETPIEVEVDVTLDNGEFYEASTTVVWTDTNDAPTADIGITDDGRAGGLVTFDSAASSDPQAYNEDALDFSWTVSPADSGEAVSVERNVGETFTTDIRASGEYDVSLTATDDRGATDTTTTTYTVTTDATPPGIESGRTYKLLNLQSGGALDVSGGSTADGADVQVWGYAGGANQQWRLESAGDGYYTLVNEQSGKALDVSGLSQENGANVHQWADVGGANQQWRIEQTQPGIYKLLARHSGKALEASGFSADDGTTVDQWSYGGGETQQWALLPVDSDHTPTASVDGVGTFYGSVRFTVTNESLSPMAVSPTVTGSEQLRDEKTETVFNPAQPDVLLLPGESRELYVSVPNLDSYLDVDLAVNGEYYTVRGRYT